MNADVEALKHFFAAVNRNDKRAITRDFDPQIVHFEPEGFRPPAPTGASRMYRRMSARGAGRGPKGAASPRSSLSAAAALRAQLDRRQTFRLPAETEFASSWQSRGLRTIECARCVSVLIRRAPLPSRATPRWRRRPRAECRPPRPTPQSVEATSDRSGDAPRSARERWRR